MSDNRGLWPVLPAGWIFGFHRNNTNHTLVHAWILEPSKSAKVRYVTGCGMAMQHEAPAELLAEDTGALLCSVCLRKLESLAPLFPSDDTGQRQIDIYDILSTEEQGQLEALETTIESGRRAFIAVGDALTTIRDGRLYRAGYSTFEAYCTARWGFGASRARQMIGAAETARALESVTDVTPATEASMRPLVGLRPDQAAIVYGSAVVAANGQAPTAPQVIAAGQELGILDRPAPPPAPLQAPLAGLQEALAPAPLEKPADWLELQRQARSMGIFLGMSQRGEFLIQDTDGDKHTDQLSAVRAYLAKALEREAPPLPLALSAWRWSILVSDAGPAVAYARTTYQLFGPVVNGITLRTGLRDYPRDAIQEALELQLENPIMPTLPAELAGWFFDRQRLAGRPAFALWPPEGLFSDPDLRTSYAERPEEALEEALALLIAQKHTQEEPPAARPVFPTIAKSAARPLQEAPAASDWRSRYERASMRLLVNRINLERPATYRAAMLEHLAAALALAEALEIEIHSEIDSLQEQTA